MKDYNALQLLQSVFHEAVDISAVSQDYIGDFSLSDSKTCLEPRRTLSCQEGCTREILKIHATTEVTGVPFDDCMLTSYGEKCDWILFDSGTTKRRFAFCELSCSRQEYVDPYKDKPGKRAKAYQQMESAWKILYENENPIFSSFILQFIKKNGIFGWREPKLQSIEDRAISNMRGFLRTPSSSIGISRTFGKGFTFIQVKYPTVFNW